ncbi:kinase-like domain-containing protein [Jimgerdemannia flammicorona]|uniref:Kinase-like domain-containing protein n=1 Tax=Jimgerdemannia flammicorona TaxID=994334 RepID=A0A433DF80_9FUNG|nr:kinase-like domain-containing protein [Jimgerdemannia flammicorona]
MFDIFVSRSVTTSIRNFMSALPPLSVPWVNGVPIYFSNPQLIYIGLGAETPTWPSAQGSVYHCREAGGARQSVVIKKYLTIERGKDPITFVMPKELVENEVYTMTKCAPHRNILSLHSIHIYKRYVFLVTPFCNGGTLQGYCFRNRVALSQMVFILKGLLSGLAQIHDHGFIHRDIKCENVFLGEDNTIVIGDFGVSSLTPTVDSSVEEAGVIFFWAPEICASKVIDHKADIWALGIVVLEILNGGKAPYEEDHLDEEEIRRKILKQGRPQYPHNINRLLAEFIDRCLERDPGRRASASELFKHPFLSAYVEEPLFPPRTRKQSSPQPEALTTNTPQTSSLTTPSVDIVDINGTLFSPVIETPNIPNVFSESPKSEASPLSSTDLSSAEVLPHTADHVFNTLPSEELNSPNGSTKDFVSLTELRQVPRSDFWSGELTGKYCYHSIVKLPLKRLLHR